MPRLTKEKECAAVGYFWVESTFVAVNCIEWRIRVRVREGENFDDVYAKRMTSEIVKMEIYVSRALAPAKVEQCSLLHARARIYIARRHVYERVLLKANFRIYGGRWL